MGYGPDYPDDISGSAVCHMEGCVGTFGHKCPRCGVTNPHERAYLGVIARWAKHYGVTPEEYKRLQEAKEGT